MTRLFSIRSAHLPGNNWCQDWTQWMQNNHPILGLFCRHRLNPVGSLPRSILLLTSICYGLTATNAVYLYYRDNEDANGSIRGTDLTYERITLFTIGGLLHSLTDLGMWHLTACACCLPEVGAARKRCGFLGSAGPFVAVMVAAVMVAVATFVVLMRVSYEEGQRDGGGGEGRTLGFVASFGAELVTVYACWHPLLSTFFFTGLIWPIFPCIGGRPKELKRQEEEGKRIAARAAKKSAAVKKDALIV